MADVLSQNEIDALLSAVSGGTVEASKEETEKKSPENPLPFLEGTAPSSSPEAPSGSMRDWIVYDLTSSEKFIRSKITALQGIFERFSRIFRVSLSSLLKKDVSINFKTTEYLRFGDFLNSLGLPTSIHLMAMSDPVGNAMCVMNSQLTYALVDAYYGGNERPFTKLGVIEEFTKIEKNTVEKMAKLAVKDMQEAWRINYPVKFEYKSVAYNPHFVTGIHSSETVAVVHLDILLENISGPLMIVIQLSALESIKQFLSVNITQELPEDKKEWYKHWLHLLPKVAIDVAVSLGGCEKTLDEIKAWKVGDTLMLDQGTTKPLKIFVSGLEKYYGLMGSFQGSQAIRICDPEEASSM